MTTAYPLPIDAFDSDVAILGRKGGGKTYTAKGMVERMLGLGRRVLVLDPLGVWAGLRTAANGEDPGFPVAIFGGEAGDLPLEPGAAEPLARIIATENLPAVLDLSEHSKGQQQQFLLRFLRELRRVNTDALTIVLEEADVFAPQNPLGDDSKELHGEIDWIARRGRFRGFRLITITQRPARLSKDVLTQCATLIAHRLPAPQDRDAVKAWVDGNGDRDKSREVFDTLSGLAVGEAWVWAPEHGILGRYRFPTIASLDTSATPRAGEKRVFPKTLAQVDITAVREALAAATPPADGKRRTSTEDASASERRGYERGLAEGEARGRAAGISIGLARAEQALASLRVDDSAPPKVAAQPIPAQKPPAAVKPRREPAAGMNAAARKMLAVLDTNPPVRRTWATIATLAGLRARGGHFNSGRRDLIDSGLVRVDGDKVEIATPSAGAGPAPSDPLALVEMWAGALSGAAPKILRALFNMGGRAPRAELAQQLGMQPRGGHWNAAWKELRDNEIVVMQGDAATLTELFMPEARL